MQILEQLILLSDLPEVLSVPSLDDEWIPASEKGFFIRRNRYLGILSYGITKKNKIHKINFWNSAYRFYLSRALPEKIASPEIQAEINRLENSLLDVMFKIAETDEALEFQKGTYRIIKNNRFYTFYISGDCPKFYHTSDMNGIELAMREIMDLIFKNRPLNILPLPEKLKELRDSLSLSAGAENLETQTVNSFAEAENAANQSSDLSQENKIKPEDQKKELSESESKSNDILNELHYSLGQAFRSLTQEPEKIRVMDREEFEDICSLHRKFLSTLPEKAEIKWERTGIFSESEVQYLSKKYPNYDFLGKFNYFIFEKFRFKKLNLRVSNFSSSEINQCTMADVNLSCSISVFSFWNKTEFESVNFERTDFSESRFIQCRFLNCSFLLSDFEDAFFSECSFQNCTFIQTKLKNSEFKNSRFSECRFSRARMIHSSFQNCDFENSSVDEAVQKESSFSDCAFR